MSSLVLINFGMSQNSAGWTIRILTNTQIKELADVKLQLLAGDTLRFRWKALEGWTLADSVLSVSQTKGEGKIVRSVVLGSVALGATGYLVGYALSVNEPTTNYYSSKSSDETDWKVILPVLGVAAGAGLGAALSPSLERTEYEFTSYSKEEKLSVLRSLVEDRREPPGPASPKVSVVHDDVVYLKNGSIIRGAILEIIPDSTIKTQTADGSLFVFKMNEVEKITKSEPSVPRESKNADKTRASSPAKEDGSDDSYGLFAEKKIRGGIRAGLSIPTGNFAATSGNESGAAALGVGFGLDVLFPVDAVTSFGGSATLSFHSLNYDGAVSSTVDLGSWTTVWLMMAGQIQSDKSPTLQPYLQPRLGLLIASPPDISSPGASAKYSTGVGFAYGAAAGIVISHHVKFEVAYMASKPEFDLELRGGTINMSLTGKLPVNILSFSLGYAF